MVYFFYSSSLNVCRLHLFVLDSHLATLWESNCPFGFLLVVFPLGSSYLCFFPFDVSDGRCGIIVSIPDHCLPFYCDLRNHCYLHERCGRHTSVDELFE